MLLFYKTNCATLKTSYQLFLQAAEAKRLCWSSGRRWKSLTCRRWPWWRLEKHSTATCAKNSSRFWVVLKKLLGCGKEPPKRQGTTVARHRCVEMLENCSWIAHQHQHIYACLLSLLSGYWGYCHSTCRRAKRHSPIKSGPSRRQTVQAVPMGGSCGCLSLSFLGQKAKSHAAKLEVKYAYILIW